MPCSLAFLAHFSEIAIFDGNWFLCTKTFITHMCVSVWHELILFICCFAFTSIGAYNQTSLGGAKKVQHSSCIVVVCSPFFFRHWIGWCFFVVGFLFMWCLFWPCCFVKSVWNRSHYMYSRCAVEKGYFFVFIFVQMLHTTLSVICYEYGAQELWYGLEWWIFICPITLQINEFEMNVWMRWCVATFMSYY